MYILHSFSNNACFNENFSDFALESVQRRLWIAPLLTAAQCSGSLADEDMTGLLAPLSQTRSASHLAPLHGTPAEHTSEYHTRPSHHACPASLSLWRY